MSREQIGAWLFRYRSWAPMFPLAAVVGALWWTARRGRPVLGGSWLATGIALAILGLAIRALVVGYAPSGTSGKNREEQVASRLTTTGLYSITRHPLYVGNALIWLGIAASAGVWWCLGVVGLVFWACYRPIIAAEESFLDRSFGASYRGWAAGTPAFFPALRRWRPPELDFSPKIVLRQEYYALYSTVVMFTIVRLVGSLVSTGRLWLDRPWLAILIGATLIAAPLRFAQRHTRWLDVEGR